MLRSACRLRHRRVKAYDGYAGRIGDLYFDQDNFNLRYLVIEQPGRLHSFLITPGLAVFSPEHPHELRVELSTISFENAPEVHDDDLRSTSAAVLKYLPREVYKTRGGVVKRPPGSRLVQRDAASRERGLFSLNEVIGYYLRAGGAYLGHVVELLLDEKWNIRYFVVNAESRPGGKELLVPAETISLLSWHESQIESSMSVEELQFEENAKAGWI